jgi:hypothetical protein
MSTIAVYYEHPDWSRPLFTEIERRGAPCVKLAAGEHVCDQRANPDPFCMQAASPRPQKTSSRGLAMRT